MRQLEWDHRKGALSRDRSKTGRLEWASYDGTFYIEAVETGSLELDCQGWGG